MNDKELAEQVADHGIVNFWGEMANGIRWYEMDGPGLLTEMDVINDWRVAGACLKSWPTTINTEQLDMTLDEMLRDPRAIIEAYVQARS